MKLAVLQGGGEGRPGRSRALGQVVRSWRQPCRYGRHLETVLELRDVDGRWHEHVEHECPAAPTPTRPPPFGTALSDLAEGHDEHEEGGFGA